MNFTFNITEGESLLILIALKHLEKNKECHETDRADATKLLEKLSNQVREAYKVEEKTYEDKS